MSNDYREYDRMNQEKNIYLDEGVWCRNCEKITTWKLVQMNPTKEHAGYAQDLLCSECAWIIATFHEDMAGHLTASGSMDYNSKKNV